MPTSLATVALAFAFLLAIVGAPLPAIILGAIGVLWECFVVFFSATP